MAKTNVENLVEEMFSGSEPRCSDTDAEKISNIPESQKQTSPAYKFKLSELLNWYSYRSLEKNARNWVQRYIEQNLPSVDAAEVQSCDVKDILANRDFGNLAVWCRISTNGFPLCENHRNRLNCAIASVLTKTAKKREEASKAKKNGMTQEAVQDFRRKEYEREFRGSNQGYLDDFLLAPKPSIVDSLKTKYRLYIDTEAKTPLLTAAIIQSTINDLQYQLSTLQSDFEDVEQVYRIANGSKKRMSVFSDCIRFMESYLQSQLGNLQSENRPQKIRKKRKINPDKLVSKIKYSKEFDKFKSIDPKKAIGCKRLVLFDTKKYRLYYYVAKEGTAGLSFKRSSVINFDPSKSWKKACKFFWKDIVGLIQGPGGVKSLQTALDKLGTEPYSVSGRITGDMLIVSWFQG